jgi:hypothetical protein
MGLLVSPKLTNTVVVKVDFQMERSVFFSILTLSLACFIQDLDHINICSRTTDTWHDQITSYSGACAEIISSID